MGSDSTCLCKVEHESRLESCEEILKQKRWRDWDVVCPAILCNKGGRQRLTVECSFAKTNKDSVVYLPKSDEAPKQVASQLEVIYCRHNLSTKMVKAHNLETG